MSTRAKAEQFADDAGLPQDSQPGDEKDGAQDGSEIGRRVVLTRASDIEAEPVVWAWEDGGKGRMPAGAITLAAGREGTGKSSFAIWLAAQITQGMLPGTLLGKPCDVIYAAVEDSWKHTIRPRLEAAGADLDRVWRVEVQVNEDATTMISLPVDNKELERAIRQVSAGLVVVDPLMSAIGGTLDTHKNRDVRLSLDPLAGVADRTGAMFLGICHFNKGSGADPSSLITGSGAFKDVARAILAFARDDEDGVQVITQTKNSLGRMDLPSLAYRMISAKVETRKGTTEVGRFVLDGESERRVQDILSDAVNSEDRAERDEAAEWLHDLIERQGEMPANDVHKAGAAAGFAKDTLKRAKPRAGVCSRKSSFGAGWVWALDDTKGAPKGAKGAGDRDTAPFAPFVLPSSDGTPAAREPAGDDLPNSSPHSDQSTTHRSASPRPPCQHEACWDALAGRCLSPDDTEDRDMLPGHERKKHDYP